MLIDYIDAHRGEFGVEPICRVLSEHGITIAPSTYYEARTRRALRDAELVELIETERRRQKLVASFGACKMWLQLRGRGHDVARCTVERLYRQRLGRDAAPAADPRPAQRWGAPATQQVTNLGGRDAKA